MTSTASLMPSSGDNEQTIRKTGGPFQFPGTPKMGKFGGPGTLPTKFDYQSVPPNWFPKQGDLNTTNLARSQGPMSGTNFNVGDPQTETIGFPGNHRVVYAKIARDIFRMPGKMSISQKYQLIFTKKQKHELDKKITGRSYQERRYNMVNLPCLNYYLSNKRLEELRKNVDTPMTPRDVLTQWTLEGVVVTEEGSEFSNLNPDEAGKERIFNSGIRGRITTYSIWPGQPRPGTKLFLIIKRMPRVSKYTLHPTASFVEGKISKAYDENDNEIVDNLGPLQIIPWAENDCDYPPFEKLIYKNDGQKFFEMAEVIYVGRVESNVEKAREHTDSAMYTDINQIVLQPTMLIHLDSMF